MKRNFLLEFLARLVSAPASDRKAWGPEVVAAELASAPGPAQPPEDVELVRRIAAAYAFAMRGADREAPGVWREIFVHKLREADRILGAGDAAAVSALLRDPAASNLIAGIDDLALEYVAGLEQPRGEREAPQTLRWTAGAPGRGARRREAFQS